MCSAYVLGVCWTIHSLSLYIDPVHLENTRDVEFSYSNGCHDNDSLACYSPGHLHPLRWALAQLS